MARNLTYRRYSFNINNSVRNFCYISFYAAVKNSDCFYFIPSILISLLLMVKLDVNPSFNVN